MRLKEIALTALLAAAAALPAGAGQEAQETEQTGEPLRYHTGEIVPEEDALMLAKAALGLKLNAAFFDGLNTADFAFSGGNVMEFTVCAKAELGQWLEYPSGFLLKLETAMAREMLDRIREKGEFVQFSHMMPYAAQLERFDLFESFNESGGRNESYIDLNFCADEPEIQERPDGVPMLNIVIDPDDPDNAAKAAWAMALSIWGP